MLDLSLLWLILVVCARKMLGTISLDERLCGLILWAVWIAFPQKDKVRVSEINLESTQDSHPRTLSFKRLKIETRIRSANTRKEQRKNEGSYSYGGLVQALRQKW
jgi:hypothetical protein